MMMVFICLLDSMKKKIQLHFRRLKGPDKYGMTREVGLFLAIGVNNSVILPHFDNIIDFYFPLFY